MDWKDAIITGAVAGAAAGVPFSGAQGLTDQPQTLQEYSDMIYAGQVEDLDAWQGLQGERLQEDAMELQETLQAPDQVELSPPPGGGFFG